MAEQRSSGRCVGRLVVLLALQAAWAAAAPWYVLYDHVGGRQETVSLRALELAHDNATLYTGWLHWGGQRAVYRHDAFTGAVLGSYSLGTIQANAIATDDRGYVYIGYGENGSGRMEVRDATLASQVAAPFTGGSTEDVEGLHVWKDPAANYYLYASRSNGVVERYDVTNASAPALDASWATGGTFSINDRQLRGLVVDDDGTVFVTQRDTLGTDRLGFLYRIAPDLTLTSIPIAGAMDAAIYGGNVYVTQYIGNPSSVAVYDKGDLSFVETLFTGFARDDTYGYSGLDIADDTGWIYVNDQWYRVEGGGWEALYYDRILTTFPAQQPEAIPEPATVLLLAAGLSCLARARRRRQ